MPRQYHKWTPEQVEFLKNNYSKHGAVYVSQFIGCSPKVVRDKVRQGNRGKEEQGRLHRERYAKPGTGKRTKSLDPNRKMRSPRTDVWTNEENLRFLLDNYVEHGPNFIANHIGCRPGNVRYKAASLGLHPDPEGSRKRHLEARAKQNLRKIFGRTPSIETREKLRKANLGNKNTLGWKPSPEVIQRMRAGQNLAFSKRRRREMTALQETATKLIEVMKMNDLSTQSSDAIAVEQADIMASTDGEWLLGQLRKSMEVSVRHIIRMAAIVRRLDELGVRVEVQTSVLPYLRKIAHGNLSAELFVALDGNYTLLNKASALPSPDQQKIARNEPLKVMGLNGDFRMVPALSMTRVEINQVFALGRIRDEAEQVGHLRERLQAKAAEDSQVVADVVRIDRKRKGIIVGTTFVPLVVLQQHVDELTKRKQKV